MVGQTNSPAGIRPLLIVSFFLSALAAGGDDPCNNLMPNGAALDAQREQARTKFFEESNAALYGKDGVKDNDNQLKSDRAAAANEADAKWYRAAAPQYGAQAAIEINPVKKGLLQMCQARRSAKAEADEQAAQLNRKRAAKLREEDPGTVGYNPTVLRYLDNPLSAIQPQPATAPPAPVSAPAPAVPAGGLQDQTVQRAQLETLQRQLTGNPSP